MPGCPGKIRRYGCPAANVFGLYRECIVPNVVQILSLSIHNEVLKSTGCEFNPGTITSDWSGSGVYGFFQNKIIVAGGCRAVFDVCYTGKIALK